MNNKNYKPMKKIFVLFVVIIYVFSLSACTINNEKDDSELSDWYDTECAIFSSDITTQMDAYETVCVTNDYIITRCSYDEYDWSSEEFTYYDSLFKYSYDGSYSQFHLEHILDGVDIYGYKQLEKIIEYNDTVYAVISSLNSLSGAYSYYLIEIDIENQIFGELFELTGLNDLVTVQTGPIRNIVSYNNQLIFHFSGADAATIIKINDDFTCEKIDIEDSLKSYYLESTYESYLIDDNRLILVGTPMEGPDIYLCLDISNNRVECIDNPTFLGDEFETSVYNYSSVNGHFFKKNSYSLYEFDCETMAYSEILNFDNCNANRWELQSKYLSLIYASDDVFVLGGIVPNSNNGYDYELIKLSKSDTDLREGKTILTAVNLDVGTSPVIAEAVRIFNETNENYYVVLYDDFSVLNYGYQFTKDENYIESFDLQMAGYSQLSTDITLSLLSGNGPDIFLNSYNYTTINNANCLLDLTPYIIGENGINVDEYFVPVFAGAVNGDATYQLPVTMNINCTSGAFIPTTEYGLSFEDYISQVDSVANGYDYIAAIMLRIEAFDYLLNSISHEIIVDNVIDLDNENFDAIVNYCSSLPEIPLGLGYADDGSLELPIPNGNMICHNNFVFSSYINHWDIRGNDPIVLTGFPSGNADVPPTIRVVSSAAIASNCSNPDGAWEFLKELISFEAQCKAVIEDYHVVMGDSINIEAFRRNAGIQIDVRNQINSQIEEELNIDLDDVFEDTIDKYEEILQSSYICYDLDPAILAIMNEEIQAYFAGDKTLEEVKVLIEDRVQTVLNERL